MNRPEQIELWQQLADELLECLHSNRQGVEVCSERLRRFRSLPNEDRWRAKIRMARNGISEATLREWALLPEPVTPVAFRLILKLREENMDILQCVNLEIPLAVKGLMLSDDVRHRRKAMDALLKLEMADRHYRLIEELVFPNLNPIPPLGAILAVRGTYQDIRRMWRDACSAIEDPDREYAELIPFVDFMIKCAREAVQREDTLLMKLVENSEGVDWDRLLGEWATSGPNR